MSILFFDKPEYAETHYKFKLPWSLLYRPWPEIFFDAPFQFIPKAKKIIWIVVKDAHRFPVTIKNIKLTFQGENSNFTLEQNLNIHSNKALEFHPIELGEIVADFYKVTPEITVEKNGKSKTFKRWNYPFLKAKPLEIHILKEAPPKPEGYYAGEMHCHTHYSSDQIEFGATPKILQEAAKAIGLDFVSCTDHAYDFAFSEEDYLKEEDPNTRFETLKQEIAKLPPSPLMLASEEVSAGNSEGENVHMTVFAPENYIPGLGDCGRYWLKNEPTLSIAKVLEQTKAPCFAAHPKAPMGSLEKFIFRRGYWAHKDISHKNKSIRGIQFWNGSRDEGFFEGKKWWIEELGKGNYLLPLGGNDAHGDLNDSVSVKYPLVSLRRTKDHIFGKVRTLIKADNLTEASLKNAFNTSSLYVTEGPALWWESKEDQWVLQAKSNQEYGPFKAIKIFGREVLLNGKLASKETLQPESLVLAPLENKIPVYKKNLAYVRAEAVTEKGYFALTAAQVQP